jgi:hypothetical protein
VVLGEIGKDERGERDMKFISHVRSHSSPGDIITEHNTTQHYRAVSIWPHG